MNRLAILAATDEELQDLRSWWHDVLPVEKRPDFEVIFRRAGIGAVAAAFSTYRCIVEDQPNCLLWIGIAGAFDRELSIGDVVEVVEDQLIDLQIEHSDGSLTGMDHLMLEDTLASNAKLESTAKTNLDLTQVRSITAQRVSGHQTTIDDLIERYDPQIEQMEGAGFFYVCLHQGLPCTQLRAISNYVEPRNRDNWKPALAVENLHKVVKRMILKSQWFQSDTY